MGTITNYCKLREGDKVKLVSGETVEFIKGKQKKFKGSMNTYSYRILRKDGTLLNSGSLDKSSFFTLEEARNLVDRKNGDKILWVNGGDVLGEAF